MLNVPVERFSNEAREVAALAMSDALRLSHPSVGTEHILGAIMGHATNTAARSLMALGITRAQTLHALLHLEIPCQIVKPPLPLAPIAQQVFVRAIAEADAHKARKIGPEHFLLAITRAPECAAAKMLETMGLSLDQVRACVKGRMP